MTKLIEEIKTDLNFIRSHELQPTWWKITKVFILIGVCGGYIFFFGVRKTIVFFAVFFFLSFLLHMLYRMKTKTFTETWLDFIVDEEDGVRKARSIGKFYYSAIIFNAIVSLIISQLPW